jgi:DNA-binding transcriptional ArsR family regulator
MQAFAALADETRLEIVDELAKGERSVTQLVALFDLTQPSISQHLKVLKQAGLVTVRPQAQRRMYSLSPDGLQQIEEWLDRYRRLIKRKLDDLDKYLDEEGEEIP